MTVSIIIAVKIWQKNLEECVGKCLELDYPDFEIIILPDSEGTPPPEVNKFTTKGTVPIQIIATGPVSPAKKRDLAINYAKGEILGFIDDDAYPKHDWLKNAVKNFMDPEVAAVGGPAVTPPEDSLRQKASGKIYANLLVSGKYLYRYLPQKKREIDDHPSCNFLVRKSILQELEGFRTDFWPGEDTILCLKITQRFKKRIIYAPDVLVYHHRRPLFKEHLKQIANYALHRGYFVKRYAQTSFRLAYFLPSFLVIGILVGAIASVFFIPIRTIYSLGLGLYILLALIFSISGELRLVPLVFLGLLLTHLTYGFWFIKGLLSKKLKEEV